MDFIYKMRKAQKSLISLVVVIWCVGGRVGCVDKQGCFPEYQDLAKDKVFEATNTCGQISGASEYYDSSSTIRRQRLCQICDISAHSSQKLIDGNPNIWWQSDTMLNGIQQVNLTLDLYQEYEISRIFINVKSPRPQNMVVYKRTTATGPWIPLQYYASDCSHFKSDSPYLTSTIGSSDIVVKPGCSLAENDISPFTGGSISFDALSFLPSFESDYSAQLRDWTKAIAIPIALEKLNTFGDELLSYFYAISKISVVGRILTINPLNTGKCCKESFYFNTKTGFCVPCNCNPIGSTGFQCNSESGNCPCKLDIYGTKCDQCILLASNISNLGRSLTCLKLRFEQLHYESF